MDIHREQTQMIGSASALLDLMDQVSRVAPMNRPILVIGERGTGKELIAERLHYLSSRWDAAFLKLNCAALPETLLDSELFGVEPGAYTGAVKRRAGRFELADKGTLFLDEIATLSMAAQEKLLRVIEYGEFERLGGQTTLRTDTRVIGATNIDLPAAADMGDFRHDLLDRIAFDVITVPPLRARRDDIPELALHFGLGMAREQEWPAFAGFSERAMDALCSYAWPGNIRELKNVVERAIARAWDGEEPIDEITFDPFDSPWRPARKPATNRSADVPIHDQHHQDVAMQDAFDIRSHVLAFEKKMLTSALANNRYNQRATARWVGLSYDQLRHSLKKHDLLEGS